MFRYIASLQIAAMLWAGNLDAINIDGLTGDWVAAPVIHEDPEEDGRAGGPDIVEVRITNDGYNLYVLAVFAEPVDLGTSELQLLVDADGTPETGIPDNSRGMDFVWEFSSNGGSSTVTARSKIGRGNLIERIASSENATAHEWAISLEALPAAKKELPVHIAIVDPLPNGDRVPDTGKTLSYTVSGPLAVQGLPIEVKRDPGLIRVVSWNVLRDAPFKNNNEEKLVRVLKALQPDIFLFQEIYDTPTEVVRALFEDNLQTAAGSSWEAVRQSDCITVSRYPILASWSSYGNIVSRHETEALMGSHLLIGNAHFPCCDNESGRVRESADILQVIETHLNDPGEPPQAILIGGDLNSGGIAPELIQLTTGRVPLEMSSPRHLYQYDQYTWGSRDTYWGASRLDFLLFDPDTIFRHKAFIMDTDLMPLDALVDLGLEENDTFVSDHLPLVLDLRSPFLLEGLEAGPMEVDGSTVSEWFGAINGFYDPDILHESLGWIRMYEEGSGYWIKPETGPWAWTGPDVWPWAYFPRFHQLP